MNAHLSIPIEETQRAELEALAKARNESVEAVVGEAIAELIEQDVAFREAVEAGLQSFLNEPTLSHDEVVERARLRRELRERAA